MTVNYKLKAKSKYHSSTNPCNDQNKYSQSGSEPFAKNNKRFDGRNKINVKPLLKYTNMKITCTGTWSCNNLEFCVSETYSII